MSPSDAVVVEDVHKAYGSVQALSGVSLSVPKGSVLGLLGPNGAGKTTLVRILTTLLHPDSGTAFVAGIDISKDPAAVREHIGLAGQYAAVDEHLTGWENLIMIGRLYHMPAAAARARARELLEQFGLAEAAHRVVGTYSGGIRRRLDLAASLVNRPPVLFLDEPTTGLDPQSRLELWRTIREERDRGTTVLLTTQYLEEADHLANHIVVIGEGRVLASGTPHELKSRVGNDVIEMHLADPAKTRGAAQVLRSFGQTAHTDETLGIIALSVAEGTRALPKVVRALDDINVEIADLELRRPTLDEAFLALTDKNKTGV